MSSSYPRLFITESGVTALLEDFRYLESNNIPGKVLATDYFYVTQPKALKKLDSFKNIEVRLYHADSEGFHTKWHIFRKDNLYKAIVGSSNLTQNAISTNKEWNVGFTSLSEGEMTTDLFFIDYLINTFFQYCHF